MMAEVGAILACRPVMMMMIIIIIIILVQINMLG